VFSITKVELYQLKHLHRQGEVPQPFLSAPLRVAKENVDEKKQGFCSEQNQAVLVKLFERAMKWRVSKRLSVIKNHFPKREDAKHILKIVY